MTRQLAIKFSEWAAACMFDEGRSMFAVHSIDAQVDCVWVA